MSAPRSRAERLTEAAAELFLKEHGARYDGEPCEYGHLGDSTYAGGPCLDEVLHLFPELGDDDGAAGALDALAACAQPPCTCDEGDPDCPCARACQRRWIEAGGSVGDGGA